MRQIPPELIHEIDALLGLKGRPYFRLVDGDLEPTECYQWSETESTLEILKSTSLELRDVMAESQNKMVRNPLLSSDPMKQMRKHITRTAPHLIEEYDLYIKRLEDFEHHLFYPTGKEPPSPPEEIKETAERIAEQVNSEITGSKFDLDKFQKRSHELWQMEPNGIRDLAKQFGEELMEYENSLQEAQKIKKDRLAAVRTHLQGKSFIAYDDVIVAPSDNQFDILRIEETNGANYGLQTTAIVEELESIDKQFGIEILKAGFDFVNFKLKKVPKAEEAGIFIENLYDFCPDFEQDEEVLKSGIVQLWWD